MPKKPKRKQRVKPQAKAKADAAMGRHKYSVEEGNDRVRAIISDGSPRWLSTVCRLGRENSD